MINIPIDANNISLKNMHYSKIKNLLENSLVLKRGLFKSTSVEYKLIDWILHNIHDILIGEIDKLRKLIDDYYSLIRGFPIKISFKLRKLTVKNLQQILKDNSISYSKCKRKIDFQKLILKNRTLILKSDYLLELTYKDYFYDVLSEIFVDFYVSKWDEIPDYSRYDFVKKLGLKTCPYCNRLHTSILTTDKKNILRPEIDHFFPKAIYPFLSMSFYNLIPSCHVCNRIKSDRDAYVDNLKSPYEVGFSDFKFKYKPKYINFYHIQKRKFKEERFEIVLKRKDNMNIFNDYFKLEQLYMQHKDIVLEILLKKTVYNKTYIEELKKNFGFTKNEIYRFLFCSYLKENDLHKRPLSKLIKDIIDDIGLLSNFSN